MADDNAEHITAREFDKRMDALIDAMTDGFSGVNARIGEVRLELAAMNSKVAYQQRDITALQVKSAANETLVGEHARKLGKIDTVAGYRHMRKDDEPADAEPITVKDVKRAVWVLSIFITIITGIVKGLPMILKAVAP